MEIYFTKIKFAGDDWIIITSNKHFKKPLLLLNKIDIERLNKEFKRKLEDDEE